MSTSIKAFICSVLLMLVVMSLLFMMSVFKFQSTLTGLTQSRLTVIGESIADSLEGAVDLGLALSDLHTADDLIVRARENDLGIEIVDIFNPEGKILFSTQPVRVEGRVGEHIIGAQARSQERNWGIEEEMLFINGVTLTDSIGQTIGGVLFTYSKAGFQSKVKALTTKLLGDMGLIFAIFAGLAFIGIRTGFRGLDQYMDRIGRAMEVFPSPDPALETRTAPEADILEAALPDPEVLEHKLRNAAHQMEQAHDALGRIGEER